MSDYSGASIDPGRPTGVLIGERQRAHLDAQTNAAKADRPATEMEVLCAQLGDSARRVEYLADKLRARVDGFIQPPPAPTNAVAGGIAPEPQPGTLNCLKFHHRRIDDAVVRIDDLLITLAGIL